MDFENSNSGFSLQMDAFLPLLLVSASLLLFFISQVSGLSSQRSAIIGAIQKQDQVVTQSKQMQARLQALAVDLLETAKTDDNAQKIVQKYNIRQQAPPGPL